VYPFGDLGQFWLERGEDHSGQYRLFDHHGHGWPAVNEHLPFK
jgi:hypothetical protein